MPRQDHACRDTVARQATAYATVPPSDDAREKRTSNAARALQRRAGRTDDRLVGCCDHPSNSRLLSIKIGYTEDSFQSLRIISTCFDVNRRRYTGSCFLFTKIIHEEATRCCRPQVSEPRSDDMLDTIDSSESEMYRPPYNPAQSNPPEHSWHPSIPQYPK